jgi:hypothetical protein
MQMICIRKLKRVIIMKVDNHELDISTGSIVCRLSECTGAVNKY